MWRCVPIQSTHIWNICSSWICIYHLAWCSSTVDLICCKVNHTAHSLTRLIVFWHTLAYFTWRHICVSVHGSDLVGNLTPGNSRLGNPQTGILRLLIEVKGQILANVYNSYALRNFSNVSVSFCYFKPVSCCGITIVIVQDSLSRSSWSVLARHNGD